MKLRNIFTITLCILCLFVAYSSCDKKNELPAQTPLELKLGKRNITLHEGGNIIVGIISGNGNYKATSSPTDIVTALVNAEKEINVTALKKGTTTITVTDGKEKSATIAVTVEAGIVELKLEKNSIEIEEGKSTTVKITSGNGGYQVSTSPEGIVTALVNEENEISVTALKKGTTTITITDGKKKSATIAITVQEKHDPDADGKFSLAIIGDTQVEPYPSTYTLFTERTEWIVSKIDEYDIRGVLHTGDVVNWDGSPVRNPWVPNADEQCQYVYAAMAMQILRDAGIPTSLSVGNHDTMATGGGDCGCTQPTPTLNCGGARWDNDGKIGSNRTYEYQRMTHSFNHYLDDAELIPTWVAYENEKVDNGYWTFEAAGAEWLVLNLELWPRTEVTSWAKDVIEANRNKNVIIQTHHMFDGNCNIPGGDSDRYGGYGDNSPRRVWNQLVEPNSHVKIVTSGHVGNECAKIHTTANGHKVLGTLQNNPNGRDFNPTRILEIDVVNGTAKTWHYSPRDNRTVGAQTFTGLSFIKK